MRIFLYFGIFAFICQFSLPCAAQKKGKDSKDVFSEEYYTQLGSNLERIHKLRLGIFVQYNQDTLGKLNAWKFNDGEDSVLLYTVPVGSINKDGYWVYHHQFISNMPDMPLYTAFEHIVPITRDSFVGHFYKSPISISLDDLLGKTTAFEEIDLKGLEEMKEKIYYYKVDFTEFHAFSAPYFRSDRDKEEDRYSIDFYRITKESMRFFTVFNKGVVSMEKISKFSPPADRYRTFLLRFYPEKVSLFTERGRKKGR